MAVADFTLDSELNGDQFSRHLARLNLYRVTTKAMLTEGYDATACLWTLKALDDVLPPVEPDILAIVSEWSIVSALAFNDRGVKPPILQARPGSP